MMRSTPPACATKSGMVTLAVDIETGLLRLSQGTRLLWANISLTDTEGISGPSREMRKSCTALLGPGDSINDLMTNSWNSWRTEKLYA